MKHSMTRLAVGLLLVATLGGCAQLQGFQQKVENAYSALSSAQIKYQYVVAAIQTYEGLKKVGAAYIRLPTCTKSSGSLCHDRRATGPIKAMFAVGDQSRDDILAYQAAHPCDPVTHVCPLMPDGVYAGLRSAVSELQSLYDTYKVTAGAQ